MKQDTSQDPRDIDILSLTTDQFHTVLREDLKRHVGIWEAQAALAMLRQEMMNRTMKHQTLREETDDTPLTEAWLDDDPELDTGKHLCGRKVFVRSADGERYFGTIVNIDGANITMKNSVHLDPMNSIKNAVVNSNFEFCSEVPSRDGAELLPHIKTMPIVKTHTLFGITELIPASAAILAAILEPIDQKVE